MLKILGYDLAAQIHNSARTTVYRGRRESDGLPVVVKVLNDEYPSVETAARFKREYELGRLVSGRGAVQILALEEVRGTRAIVMADAGGRSLLAQLAERRLSLEEAVSLGARIAAALAEIHAARVIHKDVNPSNILLDPATGQVRFIDFGLSTALPRESPGLRPLNVLEGTLRYISPEQTGRMNRAVDHRTDLYSLGVTLYEMVTGRVPFAGADPVELVHLHLAQRPVPPHHLDAAIPPAIGDVVMKLLAKTAEERYQSALGLSADLETCLAALRSGAALDGFAPGRLDRSDRFQLPQRLYGRDAQVASLLETFERAARGRAELMLITGYSGVGKSVLVNEIHKPVLARRGYFVAGKFDQLQRDIPYASLIQALSELTRQLLAEPEPRLARWRRRFTEAFGESGQIVVDIIPSVERIVGPQPPVPALPPSEAQNRFNFVFLRFIHALAAEEHPLALFLDDLQWADLPSLKLIELLLTEPGLSHVLLIGAYRDNEVLAGHPLRMTREALDKSGARVTSLSLAPLELADVEGLVAATLHDEERGSAALAALLHDCTGGNPFFLRQLLQALHDDQLITFDPGARVWRWDLEAIRTRGLTDDVAELMVRKIQKLPAHTQEALRLAASIGNQFDLDTLALALGSSPAEAAAALYRAMEESLVLPLDERWQLAEQGGAGAAAYRFLHDRVQQAAYSLIAEGDRPELHLRLGRLLLASAPLDACEGRLFDVVNQLDRGSAFIESPAERLQLAGLNLEAGKKARASAAYQPAHRYLEAGLRLLPEGSWALHHALTFDLHAEAVETAYLDTDFTRAEELAAVALENAATALEKLRIHEIQMLFHSARLQFPEAIQVGIEALRLLGSGLSLDVDLAGAFAAVGATAALLGDRPLASFAELPEASDPIKLATLRVLVSLSAPVYIARPLAFMPVVCEMVNLCVAHGNSALSAFAWADYAVVRCALGDIDGGNELGTLALALLDRFDARALRAKVLMIVCTYVRPWKAHVRDSFPLLLEAIRGGLEVGDLEFVGHSATLHSVAILHAGEPLELVNAELIRHGEMMRSLKQEFAWLGINVYRQSVLNLMGPAPDPTRLVGAAFDETIELPRLIAAHSDNNVAMIHAQKCTLACLFRDHDAAMAAAAAAEPYMLAQTGHMTVAYHNFYQSLAHLGAARTAGEPTLSALLAKVEQNQVQMKRWSDGAPVNYQHKYLLVEGERARLRGDHLEASRLFEQAASGAAQSRYINDEALAHELQGELYLALDRERLAQDSLLDAANAYRRWGAEAKVADLERRYPHVFARPAGSPGKRATITTSVSTTSSVSGGSALDLATVLKAAEAISGRSCSTGCSTT